MTENKRYFKRELGEEYYIFDSINITEEEIDEQSEYIYKLLTYSMGGDEILNKLNEQEEEIKKLKRRNKNLEYAVKGLSRDSTNMLRKILLEKWGVYE